MYIYIYIYIIEQQHIPKSQENLVYYGKTPYYDQCVKVKFDQRKDIFYEQHEDVNKQNGISYQNGNVTIYHPCVK